MAQRGAAIDGRQGSHPAAGVTLDLMFTPLALLLALLVRAWPFLDPLWTAVGGMPGRELGAWDRNETALVLYQVTTLPLMLSALGQYRLLRDPAAAWSRNRVALAVALSLGGILAMLFVLRVQAPRAILAMDYAFLLAALLAWRAMWSTRMRRLHAAGEAMRNVMVVGTGPHAARVVEMLGATADHGRRIVAVLDVQPGADGAGSVAEAVRDWVSDPAAHNPRPVRVQGREAFEAAMDGFLPEEVLISPELGSDTVAVVLLLAQERGLDCHLIPDHHLDLGLEPRPWQLGPLTLLDVHRPPGSRLAHVLKRALDVTLASVGLLVAAPLIALCAMAIKLEDPRGPVFYAGRRVGIKGRPFRQWKLATMVRDADELRVGLEQKNAREGPWFQLDDKDDPRISRVGRFLRRYSLNDLPQFWNVLNGSMSLVGPRPLAPDEAARFVEFDFRYFRGFDVKPGITGLWQIGDRLDPSFEARFQKDMDYIQNWSLWLDLKILALTPWAMLRAGR